jgi:hypothetical protein
LGLGDLNFDGVIDASDMTLFGQVLASREGLFNPAADLNGDGLVNNDDLLALHALLVSDGANAATMSAYAKLLGAPAGGFTGVEGHSVRLGLNAPSPAPPPLVYTWSINGDGRFGDASGPAPVLSWYRLAALGIGDDGTYPVSVLVSDGTHGFTLATTLTITDAPLAPLPAPPGSAWQGLNAGALALASFGDTTGQPAAPAEYEATIVWGDGTLPALGIVTTSGGTVTVSGPHVFAIAGVFHPRVTILDRGGASATTLATVIVAADVTNQVHVVSSALTYIAALGLSVGQLVLANLGATAIAGPLQLLFTNLSSGLSLANASGTTPAPYLTIPIAGLGMGQSITVTVLFHSATHATVVNDLPRVYALGG